MISKIKCPVCGKTELIRMFNPITGKFFEDYDCPYRLCNFRGNKVAVDALIQAKKQLDRAKWWLKEIVENHRYTPITTAEMALKELDDEQ